MLEVSLFKSIPKEQIEGLLKALDARIITFKKGMTILSNLNNINDIGIVASGKVSLIRLDYNGEESTVSEFKKNDVFGGCFSKSQNEELSIVSNQQSEIIFIEYDKIFKKNNKNNLYYEILIKNMIEILVHKINQYNLRIEMLTKKTIREKLIEYFHTLEREQGCTRIVLPYNYTKLSAYLSVDRTALMREIKNLRDENLIETEGRVITIIYS